MVGIVQSTREIAVRTPLGQDKLLLTGFAGREVMSQLFRFDLNLLATNGTEIPFEKLLGQPMVVDMALPSGKRRFFHGIVSKISEGARETDFTQYWAEVVPQFWLLTKRVRCRLFQHLSVIDILKQVFVGMEVEYGVQNRYRPRNYCVQYRESDFDFASRLMEEEGIFYFFKHEADRHVMVLGDTPGVHPNVPDRNVILFDEVEGGLRPDERITEWERTQEVRSTNVSLWDHRLEMTRNHLQAERRVVEDAEVGRFKQKLNLLPGRKLEILDYPGEYAKRFDSVGRGGSDRPDEMPALLEEKDRTAQVRLEQETVPGVVIRGVGICRQLACGHKFTLQNHHNADGTYLLTGVEYTAQLSGEFRSGLTSKAEFRADFTCIPIGVPYRPLRRTVRPLIYGTQTAHVVGPEDHEIFTDKFGRVKVQFHWDREGQNNGDSSCWVRVAQVWAGKRWGASFWPRVGQEVVVAFENGDPDAPIIVGSVYNAEQMPAYLGEGPDQRHRFDNKVSGIKTCSTPGGDGFNELRFDDTKGKEQLFLHAQCRKDERVGGDSLEDIGGDRHFIVRGNQMEFIGENKNQIVAGDQFKWIDGSEAHSIHGDLDHVVGGGRIDTVDGPFYSTCHMDATETVDGLKQVYVGRDLHQYAKGQFNMQAGQTMSLLSTERIVIESNASVTLKVGGSYVMVTSSGVEIFGPEIKLNCGGGGAPSAEPAAAEPGGDAMDAIPELPTVADGAKTGFPSAPNAKIAPRPKRQPKQDKDQKGIKGKHKNLWTAPTEPEPDEPKGVWIPPSGGLGDPGEPIFYPDNPNEQPPRIPASGGV